MNNCFQEEAVVKCIYRMSAAQLIQSVCQASLLDRRTAAVYASDWVPLDKHVVKDV